MKIVKRSRKSSASFVLCSVIICLQLKIYKFPSKVGGMQLIYFIKLVCERGDSMKFGDKLISLRKKAGMSQEDLASKLNVSRQSVSKWESNNTYPETDKIVQICNIFECRMDDLINDKISDITQCDRNSKNNISEAFDSLLEFIVKSINMFTSLKFKSLIKCLFELGVLGLCLFLIGLFISEIGTNLFMNVFRLIPEKFYWDIYSIVNSIFDIALIALGTIIFIHVFKVRYLDYYDKLVVSNEKINAENIDDIDKMNDKNIINNKSNKKEKVKFKEVEPKIIIRDKHTTFAFLSTVSKIVVGIWKAFIAAISIVFVVSLICLVGVAIFDISLFKYSILFVGFDISLLALIIINVLILLVMINYIINKKNNLKIYSLIFIGSLILCGIGVGIGIIGFSEFKFVNGLDGNDISKEIEVNFYDNMVIQTGGVDGYTITIDNDMSNDYIKVVGTLNEKYFSGVDYWYDERYSMNFITLNNFGYLETNQILEIIFNDLKNKVFRNIYIENGTIEVICNSKNAHKLLENAKKVYLVDYEKTNNGYFVSNYNQKIFLDYGCDLKYNAITGEYSNNLECNCSMSAKNNDDGEIISFNCNFK